METTARGKVTSKMSCCLRHARSTATANKRLMIIPVRSTSSAEAPGAVGCSCGGPPPAERRARSSSAVTLLHSSSLRASMSWTQTKFLRRQLPSIRCNRCLQPRLAPRQSDLQVPRHAKATCGIHAALVLSTKGLHNETLCTTKRGTTESHRRSRRWQTASASKTTTVHQVAVRSRRTPLQQVHVCTARLQHLNRVQGTHASSTGTPHL